MESAKQTESVLTFVTHLFFMMHTAPNLFSAAIDNLPKQQAGGSRRACQTNPWAKPLAFGILPKSK